MNARAPVLLIAGLTAIAGVTAGVWNFAGDQDDGALTLYGNVDIREVELGFRVGGRLIDMAVDEGPPVLFLDEPTSGVDPITRREFWTHINGLVHKGVTVMVTTHFMDEAEYCDRVALMYRARLIALDPPDALKTSAATDECPDPTMEEAFIRLVETADVSEPERQAA